MNHLMVQKEQMDNLPQIPLYHVGRLVAEGGTARIYWGVDMRSGFPVAIKELKIKHFKNPVIRQKFKEVETQMYLYCQHRNIPKLVDFIDMKGREQLYIVMEFIEGRTLEHHIYCEIGLMPERKALPMFLEILDTVGYLHDNGILHLDIKSNNIMIRPDGSIKLIDLGIASRMSDASNSTGFGTPAYMPPEQSEKGEVGSYTDVFALGVVLFEMLTGNLPFKGSNTEIRNKIKTEPTPEMKRFYSHIGADLQPIVERALAKAPQARYQSCGEFASVIRDYMRRHKIQ